MSLPLHPDTAPSDLVASTARIGAPIRTLGGAFMLDAATIERGASLGLDFPSFYGTGRGGVLGDVDADIVSAAFVFFEPNVVRAIWDAGRSIVPAGEAAAAFAAACQAWGRAHLSGAPHLDELCSLLERVAGAAAVPGLPLFAGWRAMPLPEDLPARAAQLCHVLREHRGGFHGMAVLASRLAPLDALLVNGDVATAALYGWPEPYADVSHLAPGCAAAETLTDTLASTAYAVLSAAERERLEALLVAAVAAAGLGDSSTRIDDARRAAQG